MKYTRRDALKIIPALLIPSNRCKGAGRGPEPNGLSLDVSAHETIEQFTKTRKFSFLIELTLKNTSDQPIKLWAFNSFYGTEMFHVGLMFESGAELLIVRDLDMAITARGENIDIIPAGNEIKVHLNLSDKTWKWPMYLGDATCHSFKIYLNMPSSKHGQSHGVWNGGTQSMSVPLKFVLRDLAPHLVDDAELLEEK
jgi:hypothetical protein